MSSLAPPSEPDRAWLARTWWRALQPYRDDGTANPTGDRAALARLRRMAEPRDALLEEAVVDLHRRLGFGRGRAQNTLPMVAVTAMVLAHVRQDGKRSPAQAVGRASFDDKEFETAAMKPLRFRRLLGAREPAEIAREMRRLVQLADGELDVGALAAAILDWPDPERGDRIRTRWAYDYLAAGAAAPPADTPADEIRP